MNDIFCFYTSNTNKLCLIDEEDKNKIQNFNWVESNDRYIKAWDKNKNSDILLHSLILNSCNLEVDHIHGRKWDNRKSQLRLATRAQNRQNSRKSLLTKNKYKGCYFHKRKGTWISSIKVGAKQMHLGTFNNSKDAAIAYNNAAIKYFGDFAKLNEL